MNIKQSAAMMARKGFESPLQVMFAEAANNSAVYFDDEMVDATPLCAMQGGDTVAVMFANGILYVVGNMTAMVYTRFYEYGFEYPESDYDSTTFGMTMSDGVLVPGIHSNERPVVLTGSNASAEKGSTLEVGVGGTKVDGFKLPYVQSGHGSMKIAANSTYADCEVTFPKQFPSGSEPDMFYSFDGGWTRYAGVSITTTGTPTEAGAIARAVADAKSTDRNIAFKWLAVVL